MDFLDQMAKMDAEQDAVQIAPTDVSPDPAPAPAVAPEAESEPADGHNEDDEQTDTAEVGGPNPYAKGSYYPLDKPLPKAAQSPMAGELLDGS